MSEFWSTNTFFPLVVIAFGTRFLVVRHAVISFDTYGHLYFIKEIKVQRSGPFGAIAPKIVGATTFRHPFLWHWLFGILPAPALLRHQKWINATLDALFSLIAYIVVLWMGFSESIAFFTALLYVFTPMWFSRLSTGPRIECLTPRLSSELAANLFFITLLFKDVTGDTLFLLTGMLLTAFIMLSSKFGFQAMIFLVPLVALISWKPMPLLALLLGGVFSLIVTRGHFLLTVKSQLRHLVWYFKENLQGKMPVSNRNSFAKLLGNLDHQNGVLRKVLAVFSRMIIQNSFTSVLIKMPVLLVALIIILEGFFNGNPNVELSVLVPILAAFLVFLLVNWGPLLFLGEAERYLNHVAFFIVFSCVIAATDQNLHWLIWLLVCYGLIFWCFECFCLHLLEEKYLNMEVKADQQKVISFLTSIETPQVILAYPYHGGGGVFKFMLLTIHKVVFCFMQNPKNEEKFNERFAADYPYVRLDKLDEMADEMGVSVLVADKKSLCQQGHQNWVPSDQWQPVDIDTELLNIYQRVKV